MLPENTLDSHFDDYAREFSLLLASIRWPFDVEDSDNLRSLASGVIDWQRFVKMARSHQVTPLVYRNIRVSTLQNIPPHIVNEMRLQSALNIAANARWRKAAVPLMRKLASAGFSSRLLKGIPLALEVFGDESLRITNDIDLLVYKKDVAAIDSLLQHEGFRRTEPRARLTPRRYASYLANWKDFSYVHPQDSITIELHWRLHRNPKMQTIDFSNEQSTALAVLDGESLAVLASGDLFLYLCIHGALEGWYKLKWLADVSAMARKLPSEQLTTLCKNAEEKGILAEVSAALLLSNQLLGANLSTAEVLPASHPTVARIIAYSLSLITANDYCPEWEGNAEAIRFELALRSSFGYRWQTVKRICFRPRMWEKYDLPDSLFPLYALISPFEWFFNRRQRLSVDRR